MRFSVDGWDPSYGTSFQDTGEERAESQARVDAGVEVSPADWHAVSASDAEADTVWFVDGVRRLEAQLWIHGAETADEPAPAICASYAAGVVRATPTGAEVVLVHTRRGLFTTAAGAADIHARSGVWGATHAAADPLQPAAQTLSQSLQYKLTELEVICAAGARGGAGDDPRDLLVIDGPLRGRTALPR
jgi:hypothetical protein